MSEDSAVEAMATSIASLDAGRRVGWAKAYSATNRADSAERDYNMAKADLDAVLDFTAFIYGALQLAAPEILDKLPPRFDRIGINSMMPASSMSHGRKVGRLLRPSVARGMGIAKRRARAN